MSEEIDISGASNVGLEQIYLTETAGDYDDDSETGAARVRAAAPPKAGKKAIRRHAGIPQTAIATGVTTVISVPVTRAFKCVWMLLSGTNQNLLLFNGATIGGMPQDAGSAPIGCDVFGRADSSFFWEWDTVNPGQQFTLSFTNTHTASVTPTGWLLGYSAS